MLFNSAMIPTFGFKVWLDKPDHHYFKQFTLQISLGFCGIF